MKNIILIILLATSSYILAQPNNACSGCNLTNTLNISTGYNPTNDTLRNFGSIDSTWVSINLPPTVPPATNVNFPNVYVIPHLPFFSNWNNVPNSRILSVVNTPYFNSNNTNPNQPWRFRRKFCVNQMNTQVHIVLNFRADDEGFVYLIDPSNNETYLTRSVLNSNYNDPSQADCWVTKEWDSTLVLNSGCHFIEFRLINTDAHAMGFALNGTLTSIYGNHLAETHNSNCCSGSKICGIKIIDNNNNGQIDNADAPGGNWSINLYDQNNNLVASTQTNQFGEFCFDGISPGFYHIKEVITPGYSPVIPPTGSYSMNIVQPFTYIKFLNKNTPPCEGVNININSTDISCCYNISWTNQSSVTYNTATITSVNNLPFSVNNSAFNTTHTISLTNLQQPVKICGNTNGSYTLNILLTDQQGNSCSKSIVFDCNVPSNETCCDINALTVNQPQNTSVTDYNTHYGLNFVLPINTGISLFEEIRSSLVSFELEYSEPECAKCYNPYSYMGTFLFQNSPMTLGSLQKQSLPHYSLGSAIPGSNPVINGVREIIWKGLPVQLGSISPNFTILFPKPILPNCCNVKVKTCIKLVFKNADCDICEKYLCLEFDKNGIISGKSNLSIHTHNPENDPSNIREKVSKGLDAFINATTKSVTADGVVTHGDEMEIVGLGFEKKKVANAEISIELTPGPKGRCITRADGVFGINFSNIEEMQGTESKTINLKLEIRPQNGFPFKTQSNIFQMKLLKEEGPYYEFTLYFVKDHNNSDAGRFEIERNHQIKAPPKEKPKQGKGSAVKTGESYQGEVLHF